MTDHHPGASVPAAAPPRKTEHRGRPRPHGRGLLAPAGDMLREARHRTGVTLLEIQRRVGISAGHASLVERGLCGTSAETLERWAAVVGLDPAAVLCAFRLVPERAAAAFFDVERMRAALAGGAS